MTDIQVLVDKSPLPPGFSPVCDPLDASEARVGGWGWGARERPCGEDQEEGWRGDRHKISEPGLPPRCTTY